MAGAIVLLSGGLDSATCLALAQDEGHRIHALSFDYGQRHAIELGRARMLAERAGVEDHLVCKLDLRVFGGSALTSDFAVPKHAVASELSPDIPITYVPARNTIFLSYALALAEVRDADEIFIGVNALDYSGYPDCRPEYITAYQEMARLATRQGVEGSPVRIRTPLIDLSKAQIISLGTSLGIDYSITSSCYDPDSESRACGHCDSCLLRLKGFADAGLHDPAPYA